MYFPSFIHRKPPKDYIKERECNEFLGLHTSANQSYLKDLRHIEPWNQAGIGSKRS